MKLNDQDATLPNWPAIKWEGTKNAYIVEGTHISYGWYRFAQWILRLAALAYFAIIIRNAFRTYRFPEPLLIFLAHFVPYMMIITYCPLPKWFCRLLFAVKTRVCFTNTHLRIKRSIYSLDSNVSVQFRASRPCLMPREAVEGESRNHLNYMLGFRRIEMVYGSRILEIATIDNPDRAEQFAIALQIAYKLSRSSAEYSPISQRQKTNFDDTLPE